MNLAKQTNAKYLRADCWLLGLSETQTERIVAHLPAWGYEKCLLFARSIAAHNAGLPSGMEDSLPEDRRAFVEPPMLPLTRKENLLIMTTMCFATGVFLAAVWWAVSRF